MNYDETLEYIAERGLELPSVGQPRKKFSLKHIRTLLAALGRPEREFLAVLVAGTNGKGSTAATLASIAAAGGVRTGLYTSPHLLQVNERWRVAAGGALREVSDEALARVMTRVRDRADALEADGTLPNAPSFFELLTAGAFCWFAEERVQLAVLEVGLGGRLDATNSVEPVVSVITDIAMDHMEYLGGTLGEIAGEKAGILRESGVLVTLSQHPEANAAIGAAAVALGVRGVDAARFLPPTREGSAPRVQGQGGRLEGLPRNSYDVVVEGEALRVDSPLAGQHQQRNLALAIATAVELRTNHLAVQPGFAALTNPAIARGIRETVWPGRLEWIAGDGAHAPLLLDVAHNPAGAWTLRAALASLPEERPRTLIFSCLADKPVEEMAQVLFPLFDARSGDPLRARDHIVLAPIQNPRAATVEQLLAAAHKLDVPAHAAPHLAAALAQARAVTPVDGVIVATGSVFLVAEIREMVTTSE